MIDGKLQNNYKTMLILVIFILNLCEWYDYSVYINLTANQEGEANAWLGFAIAYLAAPIGGLVSAMLADRFSYYYSMALSGIGMWHSSLLYYLFISCKPYIISQGTISIEYIILFMIRIIHCFFVGGMMSLSFVELLKLKNFNKGILGSLPVLSMLTGITLGNKIYEMYNIEAILIYSATALLCGIYLLLYSKLNFFAFCNYDNFIKESCKNIIDKTSKNIKPIVISCGISSISAVSFFVLFLLLETHNAIQMNSFLIIICIFCSLLGGYLCNAYNMFNFFYIITLLLSLIGMYNMNYISSGNISSAMMYLWFAIVFIYMGGEALIHNSLYNAKYINVAMVVSYNLGACIFGSTSPYFFSLSSNSTNNYFITYFFIISILSLFAILCAEKFNSK